MLDMNIFFALLSVSAGYDSNERDCLPLRTIAHGENELRTDQ